jgi:hypothetical protein
MRQRAAIGLGDAARAISGLGLTQGARAGEVASLLGFAIPFARSEPRSNVEAEEAVAPPPSVAPPPPTQSSRPTPPAVEPPPRSFRGRDLSARQLGTSALPSWWGETVPVGNDAKRLRPDDGLFSPGAESELVRTLVQSKANRGSTDIDRLVHWVAERRAITRVPRRPVRVVSGKVCVLFDRRDRMAPFLGDQDILEGKLRRVAGDAMSVEGFVTQPREVGPLWQPRRWPGDVRGARVLIVSDLHSTPETGCIAATWLSLGALLRQARADVLVLSPVPTDHLPFALGRVFRIVYWDRTIRPQDVRHLESRQAAHG